MKKLLSLGLAVLSVFISYNCKKSPVSPDMGDVKLQLPAQPYDYSSVTMTSGMGTARLVYENGTLINNYKATIGRVLFYDKALSINNSVACASCHLQKNAFADVNDFSIGFDEKRTIRNSMGINNLTDEKNVGYFWDARETKIESMVFAPIANHIEMGFERIDLITEKISNLPYYKQLFLDCYGDDKITAQRMRESIGHFLFSIVSMNSKFDKSSFKGFSDFTSSEMRGFGLFQSASCNTCHFISNRMQSSYGSGGLTFANIGLDEKDTDPGKNGLYKIPRLKNISKTAPYMHDGRFKTLDEVLEHYSHNIKDNPNLTSNLKVFSSGPKPKQFKFTDQNKIDLIAFLKTLDDQVMITDVKFSSPFVE